MSTTINANIEGLYPLTGTQEGILYHSLLEEGGDLYVQQYVSTITGDLDVEQFRDSWSRLIARHPALRSLIVWEGRDDPLQLVRESVDLPWQQIDLGHLSSEDATKEIETFLAADRANGFQLDRAPLMRLALFDLPDGDHRFVWTHHHIILDGWSLQLALDEVLSTYSNLGTEDVELEDAPTYKSFVDHLAARDRSDARDFWSGYLDGFENANQLDASGDSPGSPWATTQVSESHELSNDLTSRLGSFIKEQGLTLNTVFRAAWALVVSRYSGDRDVVFGATVAGRPPDLDRSMEMLGLFINTIPVRAEIPDQLSNLEWMRALQADQNEMSSFEWTPLPEIQTWAETRAGQPLFTSLLVVENLPSPGRLSTIAFEDEEYLQRSNYPLALLVFPGEQIELNLLHEPRRFSTEVARSLLGQVEHAVRSLIGGADAPAASTDILPSGQLTKVMDWSRSPLAAEDGSILVRIEKAAASHPEAIALSGSGSKLTYSELMERCHALAGRLISAGAKKGDRIAIDMDRSPTAIVAALAVMHAGGAYVPLDPDLPPRRLEAVLADIDARFLLVDGTREPAIAGSIEVVDVTSLHPGHDRDYSLPLPDIDPKDIAYVIFTSGSTGKPKGVAVTHGNLSHSTGAREPFYQDDPGVFLLTSPTFFDSSMAGIFWTLSTGGTLHVPESNAEQDIPRLVDLIETESVSHLLTLPSVFQLLIDTAGPGQLDSLRVAIVAGEQCPAELVARHQEKAPSARLYNEYGPTEATVWVTATRLDGDSPHPGDARPSIGKPIPGAEVFVLDEDRRPSPAGVVGEIYAGGPGVATGYLTDADQTAQRFVDVDLPLIGTRRLYRTGDLGRWDDYGRLDLIGRMDEQVKIRGRRVEPGEIEHALESLEKVSAAAVTATVGPDGQTTLVGFYVPKGQAPVTESTIREDLTERLPGYLIPARLVELDALPHNANGKLDRSALTIPANENGGRRARAASTKAETMVLSHARDLLGHEGVEIEDNFFDAGGHSLLSMHLIARVFKESGVRISPNLVLFNTLAFVAAVVGSETGTGEGLQNTTADQSAAPVQKRVDQPRWFGQAGDMFGMFHWPNTSSSSPKTPVVICPPYGWEYFKTHWALRNLARLLWEEGHPVLRFDYRGTGDSIGGPESLTIDGMIEDISLAIDEMLGAAGAAKVHLIGLRLGAPLAVLAADESRVEAITLWDPVTSGAAHLGELSEMNLEFFSKESRKIARMIKPDELLGSHYPHDLRMGIEAIDLHRSLTSRPIPTRIFVSEMIRHYEVLRNVMGERVEFEVVDDAGSWTDLSTFNSALLPTNIPRQIVRSIARVES